MATLSRATCTLFIQLLEQRTRTSIEAFFYEHHIPNEWLSGSSKKEMILNVVRRLEHERQDDVLLNLIQVSLGDLPRGLRIKLEGALRRDGFVSIGHEIVPEEIRAAEHKTAAEALIAKHAANISEAVLLHHLHEAEELFRQAKWDASIGQARNFVERLLADIAVFTARARGQTPNLERPVRVRDYLVVCGFLDEQERRQLVDGVYGYFSNEGAHPGISNQSTARVCLSILWTFGFYLLEKLDFWTP